MNAKIAKTKKALLEAFCRLLDTTPVREITVSQLCRDAGINRTTFYKYYAVPTDVVVEAAQRMMEQGVVPSGALTQEGLYELMCRICRLWYDNRALLMVYLRSSGDLMMLLYRGLARGKDTFAFLQRPENNFIAGGITAMAMQWMLEGCTQPPEQLAELLTGYILRFQQAKTLAAPSHV